MSRFGNLFRSAAAAALTAVGATPALAQQPAPTLPAVLPSVTDYLDQGQGQVDPAGFGRKHKPAPAVVQPAPYTPAPCPGTVVPGLPATMPGPVVMPPVTGTPITPSPMPGPMPSPMPGATPAPMPAPAVAPAPGAAAMDAVDFGGFGRGAGAGATVGLNGYIENAAPISMFRLRYDAAYRNNRPDRAEIFYAKCGCFVNAPAPLTDPGANGPPLPGETGIDYQELTSSLEYAINPRLSVFINLPVRFINPDVNANAAGLGDISFGAKYAFVYNQNRVLSFSLRAIAPSGRAPSGLGTANWWLEPGLLWLEQMSPKWQLFGEFRYQFSLADQSDFTGSVLRYGLGTSYMVAQGRWGYVAPVAEAVAWTVLGGQELTAVGPQSSSGATIVNAKLGVRIGIGAPAVGTPYPTRSDLYIGYGRALTGEVWYKDLLRFEYRFLF